MIKGNLIEDKVIPLSDSTANYFGSWACEFDENSNLKVYDKELLETVFNEIRHYPKSLFIDIGANTGSFSLLPALDKRIKCLSIEPNPKVYGILVDNLVINKIKGSNVIPLNYACGHLEEYRKFESFPDNESGLSRVSGLIGASPNSREICVKMHTLESLLTYNMNILNCTSISAIKLDCEGFELFVLLGAYKAILKYRPTIIVEWDNKNLQSFGHNIEMLDDFLTRVLYYKLAVDLGANRIYR